MKFQELKGEISVPDHAIPITDHAMPITDHAISITDHEIWIHEPHHSVTRIHEIPGT